MDREQLREQLDEIAQPLKETDPSVAIILLTLCGALVEGSECELADHVKVFAAARLKHYNDLN